MSRTWRLVLTGTAAVIVAVAALLLVEREAGRPQEPLLVSRTEPAWSPDGAKVAFVGDRDVYVMDADGGGERRLTDGDISARAPACPPTAHGSPSAAVRAPPGVSVSTPWTPTAPA